MASLLPPMVDSNKSTPRPANYKVLALSKTPILCLGKVACLDRLQAVLLIIVFLICCLSLSAAQGQPGFLMNFRRHGGAQREAVWKQAFALAPYGRNTNIPCQLPRHSIPTGRMNFSQIEAGGCFDRMMQCLDQKRLICLRVARSSGELARYCAKHRLPQSSTKCAALYVGKFCGPYSTSSGPQGQSSAESACPSTCINEPGDFAQNCPGQRGLLCRRVTYHGAHPVPIQDVCLPLVRGCLPSHLAASMASFFAARRKQASAPLRHEHVSSLMDEQVTCGSASESDFRVLAQATASTTSVYVDRRQPQAAAPPRTVDVDDPNSVIPYQGNPTLGAGSGHGQRAGSGAAASGTVVYKNGADIWSSVRSAARKSHVHGHLVFIFAFVTFFTCLLSTAH